MKVDVEENKRVFSLFIYAKGERGELTIDIILLFDIPPSMSQLFYKQTNMLKKQNNHFTSEALVHLPCKRF